MTNKAILVMVSILFIVGSFTGCLANHPDAQEGTAQITSSTDEATVINFSGNGSVWHLWKFKYNHEDAGTLCGHVILSGADPFHEKIVDLILVLDENLTLRYGSGAILSYAPLAHVQINKYSKP